MPRKKKNFKKIEEQNVTSNEVAVEKAETPVEAVTVEETAVEKVEPKKPGRRGRKKADPNAPKTVRKTNTPVRMKADYKEEVYFQSNGNEYFTKDIVEKVQAAYKAQGHNVGSIHSLQVYINAEEQKAYFVVNGKPNSEAIDI